MIIVCTEMVLDVKGKMEGWVDTIEGVSDGEQYSGSDGFRPQ